MTSSFPWQLVLENTIVGISYMQHRRFIWANARMAEIFGYEPGELDGMPVRMLYATQEDYDDVGRLMSHVAHDRFVTHERGMACKDGRLIWCRISGRLLEPQRADSPSVWVVQDLSDKKKAEDDLRRINQKLEHIVERRTLNLRRSNEALKAQIEKGEALQAAVLESREKFRTLFTHLPLGVMVVDASGQPTEFNRTLQGYFGAASKAAMLRLMDDERVILPGGKTTSLRALVSSRVAQPSPRVDRFEFGWRSTARRRREFAAIGAALGHGIEGFVFTFADVTEAQQRRAREHEQQAALAHASRLSLMGQMASALAHELGQPLNAAQSYLTGVQLRLERSLQDHPGSLEAIRKATRHLQQAAEIIRNMRGFISREPIDFEPIDYLALIRQTVHLLELQIREHEATIDIQTELDGAAPSLFVHGRQVEIQQVLVNLIINALEAMQDTPPAERVVVVRVTLDPKQHVCTEVIDKGPGVDPALANDIFEPYVTSKPRGLGMGLMICRSIIESHGGSLRLSRPSGPGATFRFTLPMRRQQDHEPG
jgi:PAS domain S-box-containing protein